MFLNALLAFLLHQFFFLTDFLFYRTGTLAINKFGEIICFTFHGSWGEAFLFASCPQAASISFPRLLRSLALTLFFSRCFMKIFVTDSSGLANMALAIGLYSIIFTRS